MQRFYLERKTDQTGISGIGKVLEGVVLESGKVVIAWRQPYQTIGIYNSIEEFRAIHINCHPDSGQLIFIDMAKTWHLLVLIRMSFTFPGPTLTINIGVPVLQQIV